MATIFKFPGMYQLPDRVQSLTAAERFDFIFTEGVWTKSTNAESRSGKGSTMAATAIYRKHLGEFLKNNPDLRVFDAPCGDLFWIRDLLSQSNTTYQGGDISEALVNHLNAKYPDYDISVFDITTDRFPEADMWHCRHCLMHLSLRDVAAALRNFAQSNIPFAALTTHFMPDLFTFDIETGSYRPLSLTNYPFSLPEPQTWLLDSDLLTGQMVVATGVWTREQVSEALDRMPAESDWTYSG